MAREKMAPRLQAHLRFCYCRDSLEDKQAARELRALLAVARAADPALNWMRSVAPEWMRGAQVAKLDRALSRLRSLSGLRAPSTVEGDDTFPANSRPAQSKKGARRGR